MKKIRWIYLLPAVAGAVLMTVTSCKDTDGTNDASGTFEATEVMVSSEASGRILALNVHEGGALTAGQDCGLVDTLQLYLQKRQLEAGVEAALSRRRDVETQTAYIKEQIEVNRREADRVRNLIAADAANTKQLDDITSSIKLLETQLAATGASSFSANARNCWSALPRTTPPPQMSRGRSDWAIMSTSLSMSPRSGSGAFRPWLTASCRMLLVSRFWVQGMNS